MRSEPRWVIFWIRVAVSPSAETFWPSPEYAPSVFSRTVIRSTPDGKRDLVFGKLLAGRTLAYRSKRLRNSTLIELKPSPTGVVSGDFNAMRFLRMESMVAAGSSSPCFSSAAKPASANSYCRPSCIASSTCRVASMISGPMPSPRMTVIVVVISSGGSRQAGAARDAQRMGFRAAHYARRARGRPYDLGQPWSCASGLAASPCSSLSRKSTARRRCGMTMEPPTTRPIENASNISSRFTPASLHWATW